ncbi:MAG TPA: glycosyltransferase family 39 protein [Candidatus Levybacteria bacterium]|nr:glycosyltransferase family 39 protein [Candidatus Levybacteria bacterium]
MKNKFILSKFYVRIILILIIGVAIFLRVYALGKVPSSPDWDEVALGYNAYSILETGRDEYGKFIPVVLQSFDDYKPALYAYFIIPFLKIFGLSIVSVRLPAIIFGVISIITIFFIMRELFKQSIRIEKFTIPRDYVALLTTLFVAFSPWHIQFSRVAFEAGVGLSINLIAILFFLKGLRNKYFFALSFVVGAISIYVYQSEKVYVPLLFIVLFIVFWKSIQKISKKWICLSFALALLVAAPMIFYILTNPNALSRAKGVSVFTDTTKLLASNTDKMKRNVENGDILGQIIDNRRIDYVKAFASGYLSHFQPNWLFYQGDVARHHAPFMGNLYLFTLPFILIGIYVLIFSDTERKTKYFIILYGIIAPIPASITIDVPHAVRTINFIPVFDVFASLGVLFFVYFCMSKKIYIRLPLIAIFLAIVFLNVSYYLNQYFVQQNFYNSEYWQYGWEDAVLYTKDEAKSFDQVVVTNESPLDQSYMFFLFYTKYDPHKYLSSGGTKGGSFDMQHTAFDKYTFRPINWDEDKLLKNTLFIGRPEDLPVNFAKTVYYENGEPAIIVSRTHE